MGSAPGCPQPQHNPPTGLSRELPSPLEPLPLLTRSHGAGGLCEAAGRGQQVPSSGLPGEGQAEAGIRDRVEDGSRHAGGSAPQGRPEPLRPVPRPGSRAPPPPAAEASASRS
nr:uncharacterized protein C11orf94 homolog isoform X1 [Ovis aries]